MADWADIANLWWLRPKNPQGSSSLPAFQLGAQMQQQRIQNDIETKKMMLDHQYRIDHLRTQDRLATAQIERYGEIAQERKDEEADLAAMQPAINSLAQGQEPTVPVFKSYRGAQAWSEMANAISRRNAQKALSAAQKKNNLEYDNMAVRVASLAGTDPDAIIASELGRANADGWDLESASTITRLFDKWVKPEGMTPKTTTIKTPGGSTTFSVPEPQRNERLPQSRQDVINGFVAREARRLQELGQKPDYAKLIQEANIYADQLQEKPGETPQVGKPAALVPQFRFVPGKGLVPVQ